MRHALAYVIVMLFAHALSAILCFGKRERGQVCCREESKKESAGSKDDASGSTVE